MVLIHPSWVKDESDEERGEMIVSFPEDSGCNPFSIPLVPSEARLQTWERQVGMTPFKHYFDTRAG